MAGFANRVRTLTFPELTEDGEPVLYVAVRDPRTMPSSLLMPPDIARAPDGRPLVPEEAEQRSREILARMVIGWRMYDATDFTVDDDGNPMEQAMLPLPATPELIDKLPMAVTHAMNTLIVEALNPR